jgi:hypothetical protein
MSPLGRLHSRRRLFECVHNSFSALRWHLQSGFLVPVLLTVLSVSVGETPSVRLSNRSIVNGLLLLSKEEYLSALGIETRPACVTPAERYVKHCCRCSSGSLDRTTVSDFHIDTAWSGVFKCFSSVSDQTILKTRKKHVLR